MIELTVESDLLALYLQDRLGEQLTLIDLY